MFPQGGEVAKKPEYLLCAENALDLRDWLVQKGSELVSTADKEGDDSGALC